MDAQHKQHGWPSWISFVLIALPVLYVGSFGPAVWLYDGGRVPGDVGLETARTFYAPLLWCLEKGPMPIQIAIQAYANLWKS